jgi:murein DD-endopeptidase MepM/ murein hydrolase activator NlpD
VAALSSETRRVEDAWSGVRDAALRLRERAAFSGDTLTRIAYLYRVEPSEWPRVLDPDRGLLASDDPASVAAALPLYLRALERGRGVIAAREERDPSGARAVPAILPVSATLFEPAAVFGPRTSPWTGREEFFPGIEIAAPAGSPVVAAGGGTVVFTGRVRPRPAGWLWRLGNIVVVSHGDAGATLYGHLSKVEVRRGAKVSRGDRLGVIGATGWALSPMVHYQYWRRGEDGLHPTDPTYALLRRRLDLPLVSLPRMTATRFPGPIEQLPGVR